MCFLFRRFVGLGPGFAAGNKLAHHKSTSSETLEESAHKRAIDAFARSSGALGALRTAAVALPYLRTLADDGRASASRLLLSILRAAAALSPLLSSDPNTHVDGLVGE